MNKGNMESLVTGSRKSHGMNCVVMRSNETRRECFKNGCCHGINTKKARKLAPFFNNEYEINFLQEPEFLPILDK